MNFTVFFLRVVLGIVIAVVLMRIFHPEAGLAYTAVLGVMLVAGAYLLDHLRKRGSGPGT